MSFNDIINWGLSLVYFIEPYLIIILSGVLVISIVSLANRRRKQRRTKLDELKSPTLHEPIIAGGSNGYAQQQQQQQFEPPTSQMSYKQQFDPPVANTSEEFRAPATATDLPDPSYLHLTNISNYNKMLAVWIERKRALEYRRKAIDNEIASVENQIELVNQVKQDAMELVKKELDIDLAPVQQTGIQTEQRQAPSPPPSADKETLEERREEEEKETPKQEEEGEQPKKKKEEATKETKVESSAVKKKKKHPKKVHEVVYDEKGRLDEKQTSPSVAKEMKELTPQDADRVIDNLLGDQQPKQKASPETETEKEDEDVNVNENPTPSYLKLSKKEREELRKEWVR